jgi:hypothetical protein
MTCLALLKYIMLEQHAGRTRAALVGSVRNPLMHFWAELIILEGTKV